MSPYSHLHTPQHNYQYSLYLAPKDYTVSGVGEDAGGNVTYTGGGTPLTVTTTNQTIEPVVEEDFDNTVNIDFDTDT